MSRHHNAGALVDVSDKEGYTPLHMATGYFHTDACTALLAGGADATLQDRQGRDIAALLDSLREKMTSAAAAPQRMRLEEVNKALIYFEFEDVAPAALLDRRTVDGNIEYLVQWRDDVEDTWVPAHLISDEVCLNLHFMHAS
jgi:signal recognition particle 43 kDa protein